MSVKLSVYLCSYIWIYKHFSKEIKQYNLAKLEFHWFVRFCLIDIYTVVETNLLGLKKAMGIATGKAVIIGGSFTLF